RNHYVALRIYRDSGDNVEQARAPSEVDAGKRNAARVGLSDANLRTARRLGHVGNDEEIPGTVARHSLRLRSVRQIDVLGFCPPCHVPSQCEEKIRKERK